MKTRKHRSDQVSVPAKSLLFFILIFDSAFGRVYRVHRTRHAPTQVRPALGRESLPSVDSNTIVEYGRSVDGNWVEILRLIR